MDKGLLTSFADNTLVAKAVREYLESKFTLPLEIDPQHDDALLGQAYRARSVGLKVIKDAFAEIQALKSRPPSKPVTNPAR